MDQLTDLKAILHSKRANIYYLEMCRVMQKDGRVVYLSEDRRENRYWNIPIANTTCLLLGTGTSITQAAMRMLSQAGVLVGFRGAGGTPLFASVEIEWLTPQSEYRPTEYVQGWLTPVHCRTGSLEIPTFFLRYCLFIVLPVDGLAGRGRWGIMPTDASSRYPDFVCILRVAGCLRALQSAP